MKKLTILFTLLLSFLFVKAEEPVMYIHNGSTRAEIQKAFPTSEYKYEKPLNYILYFPENEDFSLAYYMDKENVCVATLVMWPIEEFPYILYSMQNDKDFVKLSQLEYFTVSKTRILKYYIYPDYENEIVGITITEK